MIALIEANTSVEVVVAIRERSGPHRSADLIAGALCAFLALLLLLFLPQPFAVVTMPLDVLAAFGLGAALSSRMPALRRLLTGATSCQGAVRVHARAAFLDLGVHRTTGRTGLLIYVSLLERRVELVPDTALDSLASEDSWREGIQALQAPVARLDYSAFLAAVEALGLPLARALPRREDDINELPDLPSVGAP